MTITTSVGVGSGIDINTMVSQLVAAEGKPAKDAIARQESAAQSRLSGIGTLKSALSTFQTAVRQLNDGSLFETHKVSSTDDSVLTATAGVGSVAGSHAITVTQLAKAQKSTATTEFSGLSEVVGTGALTFTMGNNSTFSVTVDSTNNTLAGIRDAINNADDNKGITASIINVNSTANPGTTISKLVFTAKDSGAANGFSIDAGGDANLSRLATSTEGNFTTSAATDAMITIDGETATRSTNEMTDVIQGVTLNLKKLGEVNFDVSLDQDSISKSITDFVSAYNSLNSITKSLGKYGGTGATATGNGLLLGNSTLRMISSQIRQNTTGTVTSANSSYNSLAMIGISIDKDGLMTTDKAALKKALTANLSSVNDVFTSSNGVASRLGTKLTEFLSSGGPLDSQTTSLNNQLKSLSDRKIAVQERLDSLQKTMQKQFIAMDVAVGKFAATGAYLTKQFS
ncbi:MAG: flagellar filament capping protein FliD [Methylococcales bacterium]